MDEPTPFGVLPAGSTRFTQELTAEYASSGAWRDADLSGYLVTAAERWPDAIAAINVDPASAEATAQISYGEMLDKVRRVAGGLVELGVRRGDVVAMMLPNRFEFAIAAFAAASLGAVVTGVPITYRDREVSYIIGKSRAKVLVTVHRFRKRDLVEFAGDIQAAAEQSLHVVLVDGEADERPDWSTFDDLLAHEPTVPSPPPPDAVVGLGFTSGTTSEPKAVMTTHQTLDAVVRGWHSHIGEDILGPGFVNLIGSPVGHASGFIWGTLMTTMVGGTAIYPEFWSPTGAALAIDRHQVQFMLAAPTFFVDLLETEIAEPGRSNSLRMLCLTGAPIPRPLLREVSRRLDCFACPAWGMTEYGIAVSAAPHLDRERTSEADGVPVPGAEARVVDDDDQPVAAGQEGHLQITGSGLFAGYFENPEVNAEVFVEGWFRTGDRAVIDPDGWVTITGRSKDIVIRGGENIPVAAIEGLLSTHPAIREVAVIGLPDRRLGETATAVVVPRDGESLDFPAMVSFLLEQGLSKHYLPEGLEIATSLPKTPSGKVRKVELRELYASSSADDG